jgi:hypothetical protein
MQVDIFIRSYRGDFPWLEYCLKSIYKYAKGFGKVHICIPSEDFQFLPVGNEVVHLVEKWNDDYLGQQYDKLRCDEFSHAPYILSIDSDTVFIKETNPSDFFRNGKPVWLYEKLEDGATPWPPIVERALGVRPEYEFMRRHPFVFSSDLLREFRKWFSYTHGEGLRSWMKKQPYREFTEFNTFGAWAYENNRDKMSWLHPNEHDVFVLQKWSWGGLNNDIKSELEKIVS